MKMRKVIVTLEIETDVPLCILKKPYSWDSENEWPGFRFKLSQVQVNVVGKSDHEKHVALARKFRETLGG